MTTKKCKRIPSYTYHGAPIPAYSLDTKPLLSSYLMQPQHATWEELKDHFYNVIFPKYEGEMVNELLCAEIAAELQDVLPPAYTDKFSIVVKPNPYNYSSVNVYFDYKVDYFTNLGDISVTISKFA